MKKFNKPYGRYLKNIPTPAYDTSLTQTKEDGTSLFDEIIDGVPCIYIREPSENGAVITDKILLKDEYKDCYLIVNMHGFLYPIPREKFEKTYISFKE